MSPNSPAARSGRLVGNLVSLLTTLKGLPMTYNRDLQEDKEPLFDSVDTVKAALEVMAGMISTLTIHPARMRAAADDANLLATDLADYLVLKKVPFRDAHEIVGKLVALTTARGCGLRDLTLPNFQSVSPVFETDVTSVLDLDASMPKRAAIGAPAPENVRAEITRWKKALHA